MRIIKLMFIIAFTASTTFMPALAAQPDKTASDGQYTSPYSLACDYLFAVRDKNTSQMLKLSNLAVDKQNLEYSQLRVTDKIKGTYDILKKDDSGQLAIIFTTQQVETGETIYKGLNGKIITKEEWEQEGNQIFVQLSKKYDFDKISDKADWTKGPVSDEAKKRETDTLNKIWDEKDKMLIQPQPVMKTVIIAKFTKGEQSTEIQMREDKNNYVLESF